MGIRSVCLIALLAGACEKRDRGGENVAPAKGDPGVAMAQADAAPLEIDAAPRAELVVEQSPPKAGTSSIITFDAKLDLDMNFGGLAIVTSNEQSKKKKVEIVAVDPDGTVQKRITYIKRDTKIIVDGDPKKDETPIRGKTYRVTWRDAVVDVKRTDGKPVTEEEDAAVRKEETMLQVPELLGKALAGLRLVEHEPFDVPAAVLERLMEKSFKLKRLVLTYRGKTEDGARIHAVANLVNEEREGLKMFLDLKGELLIDPTGWCLGGEISGQIRAELNGSVVGSGAGTGIIKATPLR